MLLTPSASIGIATASSRTLSSRPAPSTVVAQDDPAGSAGRVPPPAVTSTEELLSKTDAAMYEAKRSGRGRFRVFDDAAHHAVTARHRLELELRGALAGGQLRLHDQPIVDLRDGATWAVEALLRWQHPDGQLRTAGEFIDVAEQIGLLPTFGPGSSSRCAGRSRAGTQRWATGRRLGCS